MKTKVLGALAAFATALPLAAMANPESYTLDPYHTFPHFEVDHAGVSTLHGFFRKTSGKFTIDRAAKAATLDISVETASIDTGDSERGSRPRTRDEHLRTADFFNVAEFPRMTYKSTAVRFAGDNPAEITGNLTMVGVTKPLALKVDRWACKEHPVNKKQLCGGNASGTLKRSEFGMKYGLPGGVGDDLKLSIEFEGFKD